MQGEMSRGKWILKGGRGAGRSFFACFFFADQEKIMILAKISQLPIDNFFILCYDIYIWDFLTV